jgi:hypothetical protein
LLSFFRFAQIQETHTKKVGQLKKATRTTMALALNPVRIQQALDPRVNLREEIAYNIYKGGSTVTQQPSVAVSFNTSTVSFTCNPPSPFVIVDRKVYLLFNVQFNFVGTSEAGNLLQIGVQDAPRSWPIHRAINTIAVNINNSQVSLTVFPVLSILQRCNIPKSVRRLDFSMSPVMPDMYYDYSGGVGAIRNPLGNYNDEPFEIARGGFQSLVLVSNSPTAAVVNAIFCEPLLVSPLCYGAYSEKGFYGVQNMNVQLTLQSNLSRMWSHAQISGNQFTGITPTVSFNAAPILLFTYITPNPVVDIPKSLCYSYYVVDYYNTDMTTTLASGASTTLISNVITLSEMPRQMFIAVRQRDADLTVNTSDVFAVISAINITMNNQSGILASATQQDLYRISMENGIDIEWPAWSNVVNVNGVGSVVLLVPGKDIGLPPTLASGVGGQFNLQVSCSFTNPAVNPAGAIQYSLYILCVREGIFTLQQNRSIPQLNVVTPDDVLRSNATPLMSMPQRTATSLMYGGDFLGFLKSIGRNLGKGALAAVPYVERALPYIKKYAPRLAGLGLSGGRRRRRRGAGFADVEESPQNGQISRDQLGQSEGSDGEDE